MHDIRMTDFDHDFLVVIFELGSIHLANDSGSDRFLLDFVDLVVDSIIDQYL